ncbi:RPAP1-like protein [Bombardia bombarda]|uniref:RPAP1-like protein n=1 Tax=Bombardia bombarda TaxID=252184 RepID=A0AA40C5S5_9PEZI|nr:RPAP1-like protein [Bombardia bombarda]
MEATLQVFDVKERATGDVKAPSFPTPQSSTASGFPAHKKRVSAFKQQRQAQQSPPVATVASPSPATFTPPKTTKTPQLSQAELDAETKRRIDQENSEVLQSMAPDEIIAAQRDLFSGLDPALVQMLLRRATLDQPKTSPSPFDPPTTNDSSTSAATQSPTPPAVPEIKIEQEQDTPASTHAPEAESPKKDQQPKKPKKTVTFNEDAAPAAPPSDLFPVTSPPTNTTTTTDPEADGLLNHSSTHFPPAPSLPDLDPSDPDFLATIHKKYFPNLPADPSKLAWMAPIPTPDSLADRESPYYPAQASIPISALRFDFRGQLLPPRAARHIPVTKGLHHHGEAPEAAGYTIPELARLARSAVAAQRCLAFQMLGRMLYRLGKGEWGVGAGGRDGDEDDLAFGMWRCFLETKVLETLGEAASVEHGHMSSKAYATEALWLFEKGGWKEKWRGL